MAETFKQYRQRLHGYLGQQDPLKVQAATPGKLERLIRGVSRKKLQKRPAPGKWSPAEILAHLADSEVAMGWRLRQMLARKGARLQAFDQNGWAKVMGYARQDPRLSLDSFKVLRRSNVALLKKVPRRKWNSIYGMHEERGKETIANFVRLYAGHDLNHLRQIQNLIR